MSRNIVSERFVVGGALVRPGNAEFSVGDHGSSGMMRGRSGLVARGIIGVLDRRDCSGWLFFFIRWLRNIGYLLARSL